MQKTPNTPRKTAKYYRDILNGNSIWEAISVLPEIIRKYGSKRWPSSKHNDFFSVKDLTEFEWNHQIEAFGISRENGRVYVSVYWQGDSTDGNDSVWADTLVCGKTIPAVHEWLGDRTYCKHGDLRISAEEFRSALKAIARRLEPESLKAMRRARLRQEMIHKVFTLVDESRRKDSAGWNGRMAVQKLLEKEPALLEKPWADLEKIVLTVLHNNERDVSRYEKFVPNLSY